MGEQRPMFRFRLPWMMSSAPAPPVATPSPPIAEAPSTASQPQIKIEPNVNPTVPARRPFRFSGMAPAPPPPPIQPIVESRSEPITITSTPRILPQASPIWSPKVSATQDPQPRAEVPPETKSQSEKSFQAASPSPSPPSPQLRATSQLPSPQLSVISRPPSPPQLPSQLPSPKSAPQASSPWPISSKSRDASRPSSPGTATKSPPRAESPVSTFQPQTNIEPNINPATPVQRPFRLPGIAPAQPPPSIQPTVQRQSQSEPIAITSGPTPSSTSAQSSATPQPPSQLSATPQPPSPWRILSEERDTSQLPSSKSSPQPSSPWRGSSKARDGSKPSSPDRHQFQKSSQAETVQQPRSPSQLDFLPPKKTSPITSSPSLTATDIQQTRTTPPPLPSPSTMSTHLKSPQPSSSFDKPLSPVLVKPNVDASPPQSPEDQSKTKITSIVTFKSPTKATVQPTENVAKPPKTDIEMVQNTSLAAQEEPKERTRAAHFADTSGFAPHNKEKLKIPSQAEQRQLTNQDMVYEKEVKIPEPSSPGEKQTNTMTSQQADTKSTVSESRKKSVISKKDRIPFKKELRNDISMFVQKMAMAHTENSKDEQLASVVALAGKNKGASMKLGSFKNHGANKTEPVEGTEENERNDEIDQDNQITKAVINNNVQDINNSILMNTFITERNPGVHVALSYDPTEPIMS